MKTSSTDEKMMTVIESYQATKSKTVLEQSLGVRKRPFSAHQEIDYRRSQVIGIFRKLEDGEKVKNVVRNGSVLTGVQCRLALLGSVTFPCD
ncbi:hypothetical protein KIN20_010913 [Parelaphostrongylus tenuis]|uniref:Uncharacterized protein n=1 Tax=Parelaphostrongylus tenuis TaxID=148309 RepID=A0AAD5MAB1_PARTN|nr:hypothetical protein KIN20_010913 [Parelaphostrongylus tenuis]